MCSLIGSPLSLTLNPQANPQFVNVLVATTRGSVAFKVTEVDAELPVEVLLALFLRSISKKFSVADIFLSGNKFREVVLVVPENLNADQVGLLKHAAELAGFKVRALVSSTRSCLHYSNLLVVNYIEFEWRYPALYHSQCTSY